MKDNKIILAYVEDYLTRNSDDGFTDFTINNVEQNSHTGELTIEVEWELDDPDEDAYDYGHVTILVKASELGLDKIMEEL